MSKKNSNVILKNGFEGFEDLSKIFRSFKKKINLLKRKSFVISLSGGPDSLALAALAKAYSYEKKISVYYVLINHNIRKNSYLEAKQVKKLLKKHDINLKIFSNNEKIFKNVQSKARNIRYNLISNFCKKKNIKVILTAHNLEDQVETFFIRLSRGSGLTGLSSMKIRSKLDNKLTLYRPLLDVRKKSLEKISKKIFGKYFIDPSNKDNKYLRTKIRALKKPLNKSGISYDQIIKSINNLAASKNTLDEYLQKISKEAITKSDGIYFVNLIKFKSLNLEIQMTLINNLIKVIKKNYYNPRSKKVIYLIKNLKSKSYTKSTLAGCEFVRKGHFLRVKKEKIH